MKKTAVILLSLIAFFSFNFKDSVVGTFKTKKSKNIKQRIIEIFPNGTIVYYYVLNIGADSSIHWSGDIVNISYGYWEKEVQNLIVRHVDASDTTIQKAFKSPWVVESYFSSVCPGCPEFPIYDTGKDIDNRVVVDTIQVVSKNKIIYHKELFTRY